MKIAHILFGIAILLGVLGVCYGDSPCNNCSENNSKIVADFWKCASPTNGFWGLNDKLAPSGIEIGLGLTTVYLAVGITFSFLLAGSLAIAVIIIGLITFVFSYAGFYLGKSCGHFFETGIEALGGLILLAIVTKILLEHLFFSNI